MNTTQDSSCANILDSSVNHPLASWSIYSQFKQAQNGYWKRVMDEDIKSKVVDIIGSNANTMYITTRRRLGIKWQYLVLLIKNLHQRFAFEVKFIDDHHFLRCFRFSNFENHASVQPHCACMPLAMSHGWIRLHLDLADFTNRIYGTNYVETLGLQIYANVRIRRIYFTHQPCKESELPPEYCLLKKPKTNGVERPEQKTDGDEIANEETEKGE
ncbi:cilia- and flagella-associated protein 20-like isoform X1 [Stomoxys calcitrans]|uniref:cilia- and flagella-associated protein 20-like isoform X1 n=1 Tax=Stomoxys calcitrans TaxID=35570 RepID=UPI0027E2FF45|nr:cilia- and flagella-associated protein 20-like isoform X1 [Stomoxys calcitrans]